MNLEITQENLHLLLPGKVANVAAIYAEEHKCEPLEAVNKFYLTKLYQDLSIEETKLWHLGPVALYEIWEEEDSF
ncbi:MAG: hypothetical protein MJZ61_05950 [Bacteroidales bacterium]|nr:hypothetical protein [Bacteroidales bacterium]